MGAACSIRGLSCTTRVSGVRQTRRVSDSEIRSAKSMKPARISFYGNFAAGNLGNECTLQAVIEQTLRRWPDAQLLCHEPAGCADTPQHRGFSLGSSRQDCPHRGPAHAAAWRVSSELLSSGYLSSWFTGSRACARSAAQTCSSLSERESSRTTCAGRWARPMTY
jgi:hypothetical protein